MDIYFCDLCNESVPQIDLDQGRAWQRGNRVVCSTCERLMSEGAKSVLAARTASAAKSATMAAAVTGLAVAEREETDASVSTEPAPSASPTRDAVPAPRGGGGWFVGVLALLVAGGVAYVGFDRIDATRVALEASDARIEKDRAQLSDHVNEMERTLAGRIQASEMQGAQERTSQIAGLTSSFSGLKSQVTETSQALATLRREIDEMRAQGNTATDASNERLGKITQDLTDMQGQVAFHNDRLIELEERVHALAQASSPLASSAQGAAPGTGAPAWQPMLADLSGAQASVRLDALYALAQTGDAGVIPYVIPMLEDVDLFVRMAAARVLENMKAKSAVPALIDALEDPETVVTESASFALKEITGKDFGFEPEEGPADRAKKVKAWREWWKKEGEAFLAGS
jgi:hypothetical protein